MEACGYQGKPSRFRKLWQGNQQVPGSLVAWAIMASVPTQMAWKYCYHTYQGNTSGSKDWKDLLDMTAITDDQLDLMMQKWDLRKAIQICSWVAWFVWNSRTKHQQRITKPVTTEETTRQVQFWARRSQDRSLNTTKFEEDKLQLKLQKNAAGIFECRGGIQGVYPIYLPDDAVFAERLVMYPHLQT